MKINTAHFLKSATRPSEFPRLPHPEFAFLGRSNTGKSSLINLVTGRKGLVKVGAKPGVTRCINFFILNESITLVDLPGFGYAKAPEAVRRGFITMINHYLEVRDTLRMLFLLVDIRREPGDFEQAVVEFSRNTGIPLCVVATKCDKVSINKKQPHLKTIASALGVGKSDIVCTSSQTGEGKKELLRLISIHSSQKAVKGDGN